MPNCGFGGTADDGMELLLSDPPEEGPQWVSLQLRRVHMHQTAEAAHQLSAQLQADETYCAQLRIANQHLQAGHLQARIDAELKPQLQHAEEAETSLAALGSLEQYFEDTRNDRDGEKSQQLWAELPLYMHEMIVQKSHAWLALRSRHLVTGSSAFNLLLCGAGGRCTWIPAFRRGAWPTYSPGCLADLSHLHTCEVSIIMKA
jgi:hypothetical protein